MRKSFFPRSKFDNKDILTSGHIFDWSLDIRYGGVLLYLYPSTQLPFLLFQKSESPSFFLSIVQRNHSLSTPSTLRFLLLPLFPFLGNPLFQSNSIECQDVHFYSPSSITTLTFSSIMKATTVIYRISTSAFHIDIPPYS